MNIELFLYLAEVFESISIVSGLIFIAIFFGIMITLFFTCNSDDIGEEDCLFKKVLTFAKRIRYWMLFLLLLSIFVPSQKTMYMILGAHYLKKSSLPTKVELMIEKRIDEYLEKGNKK